MIKSLTVFALLAVAVLAGCSSSHNASSDIPVAGQTLPGWVLVVPVEEDGRNVFVGGCSMALTAAEGIEAARTDAYLQITSMSGSLFTDVYAGSPRSSGTTTTGIDRLDFRETGLELYPEKMISGVSLDRVYLRSCETGEIWELSVAPDRDIQDEVDAIDGAACSVFVQVSLDTDSWERNLSETLREMSHTFRSQGRDNIAQLADWVDGHLKQLLAGEEISDEGAGARD